MYMLQLFDDAQPASPVEVKLLREGLLRIGRDVAADWPIADPDCAISRAHCELQASSAGLSLVATGANGVFDEATGARFPDGVATPLAVPGAFRLGRFRIQALNAPHDNEPRDMAMTMMLAPPLGASASVPTEWADAASSRAAETAPMALTEGSLLEAFCEGAGLDASLLSGEEPTEIMRRAGAVYRQMVLGVGDLMAERDQARVRYQLNRTTIGGAGNNPFKWAPTQRLAVDLLCAGPESFLSGPAAIRASLHDLKRHLVATFAGLQGSLRAAVDSFAPDALDAEAGTRGGLLKSRHAAQAEVVIERHAALTAELAGQKAGELDRAFVRAYDRAESELRRNAD